MIRVNLAKAKRIAHDKRRAKRAAEFAPLDDQIAKQIPGTNAAQADAQRQAIREKYAQIQTDIDAAPDAPTLTAIVKEWA